MLKTFLGSITEKPCDVVVCACGKHVHQGPTSGLARVIGKAAGRDFKKWLKEEKPSLKTTECLFSPSGLIPCKEILHAVGPRWMYGLNGEEEKLYKTYDNLLNACRKKNYSHVLLPAISCGVYRFPLKLAAEISIASVKNNLEKHGDIQIEWLFLDEKIKSVFDFYI